MLIIFYEDAPKDYLLTLNYAHHALSSFLIVDTILKVLTSNLKRYISTPLLFLH